MCGDFAVEQGVIFTLGPWWVQMNILRGHLNQFAVFFCSSLLSCFAYSADFYISSPNGPDSVPKRLNLVGEIRVGDVSRLHDLIKENPWDLMVTYNVSLDSPGGNVEEAIKLAEEMQNLFLLGVVESNSKCLSACFFIYVAMPRRYVDGGQIGIHRPYFDRKQYAKLNQNQARDKSNELYLKVNNYLSKNQVPIRLIDLMMRKSSDDLYFLTTTDLEELGDYAPYAQEMLLAKCGKEQNPSLIKKEQFKEYFNCNVTLGGDERANFIRSIARGTPAWKRLQQQLEGKKYEFWR
jgi:hypothetical protein